MLKAINYLRGLLNVCLVVLMTLNEFDVVSDTMEAENPIIKNQVQ